MLAHSALFALVATLATLAQAAPYAVELAADGADFAEYPGGDNVPSKIRLAYHGTSGMTVAFSTPQK